MTYLDVLPSATTTTTWRPPPKRVIPSPPFQHPAKNLHQTPAMPTALATNSPSQAQGRGKNLNVKHKSSKPIINWFQRKLAGTVRTRRVSAGGSGEASGGQRATSLKELHTTIQRASRAPSVDESGFHVSQEIPRGMSNEISLDGDDDMDGEASTRKSVSIWSRSNPLEADEDASIRPLPPTSPPSPAPSRSSSSYLSDPRTFKSMSASTKPTTLLSIDISNGLAHIAQAPPTPTHTSPPNSNASQGPSPTSRFPPHVRTPSNLSTGPGTSITFSALPPSPQSSSRPSSLNPVRAGSGSSSGPGFGLSVGTGSGAIQAPLHTAHHPRNNPRPSSPPLDNASMLTLASSAFATSGARTGGYAWTGGYAGDSVSHLGGGDSLSHFVVDDALMAEDRDASVRALRPRSSRRGSWDSEASGWSARVSGMGGMGLIGRERSVRTAPSFRTGGQATMDDHDGNGSLLDDSAASMTAEEEEDRETESPDGDEDVDDEGEKEEREPPSAGSYDDQESQEEALDDDELDVSTPGPKTKPLQSIAPDTTPRKEQQYTLEEENVPDVASEVSLRDRRDTIRESGSDGRAKVRLPLSVIP